MVAGGGAEMIVYYETLGFRSTDRMCDNAASGNVTDFVSIRSRRKRHVTPGIGGPIRDLSALEGAQGNYRRHDMFLNHTHGNIHVYRNRGVTLAVYSV